MIARITAWALLLVVGLPVAALAQDMMPPHENLPPHIKRLTWFGERADFSLDGERILFLSKTFGDAMEVEIETGIIRNLTANYPHNGYTRALYLANGDIFLAGPREFDPASPGTARTNSWMWILDPDSGEPAQPINYKVSEGPALSRTEMEIIWSYRAGQFPGLMPAESSQLWRADIVFDSDGEPDLANVEKLLDSVDLPYYVELEPQNFIPPANEEIIVSAYDFQDTDVFGLHLETGEITNYSDAPGIYAEPEGIFPSGEYTTVESDLHQPEGWDYADIYRLALDGSGEMERMTFFAEVPTYRSSNPVISDDGRYMAFQMGRAGVAAGTGYGIFLYDFSLVDE